MKIRMQEILKMLFKIDLRIFLSTIVLSFFGLLMIASASMGLKTGDNSFLISILFKQFIFVVSGLFMIVFCIRYFNFNILAKNMTKIMYVTVVLLLVAGFSKEVGGAKAWITLPLPGLKVSIQPSEFAKITVILMVAHFLSDKRDMNVSEWDFSKKTIVWFALYFFLILVLQSDLGSASVLLFIGMMIYLIPTHRLLYRYQRWNMLFIVLGVFGVALLLSPIGVKIISSLGIADYKVNRFIVAADPFSDKLGTGYQLVNGLISFASGGLFGLGFGTSIRKYTNFPAANTDFILAIIVEELGIVGFIIIFTCYILIIYRLFYWALKMKNQKGKVILIGTAMYIFIHFVFNVGGGTALIPLTGVPLLMISQGGSSTMSIMMCIGLSLSVIHMYKSGVIV